MSLAPSSRSRPALREPWRDQLGRPLRDLRVSVTDRCNFRCRYCMPRESVQKSAFLPRSEVLRFEEIVRLVRLFVQLGVQKVRLTGGEPLLRKNLAGLVEQLARHEVADLALTTNGVLLPEQATSLRAAGLGRITVSLDALDETIFQRMSDAPAYTVGHVLRGIEAAERAGFSSLKINCVVRRGVNESQVLPLLRHFEGTSHELRFIEFMDVGTRNEWNHSEVFSRAELIQLLSQAGTLTPAAMSSRHDVAQRFRFERPVSSSAALAGTSTHVGIIASVSQPFCGDCSRARLSADGKLFSCLFAARGADLKEALRLGHSDDALRSHIASIWSERSDRYSEERAHSSPGHRHLPLIRAEMSYIGG